jgi:uncharacterized membrane protein
MMREPVSPTRESVHVGGDAGSIMPLAIFYSVLSLVLVLIVVAATSLYLERKRLFTLADGAAIVGAEAFDLQEVAVTPDGPQIVLRSDDVAAAVGEYVAANPSRTLEDVRVERADSVDGSSATVVLSASWSPPVLVVFVPEGIRLEASVVAQSVVF